MIELKNLWFRYHDSEKWVLKRLNFKINSGSFTVIVGPNSSGKTTLARLLVGLVPEFYKGEIKGEIRIHNFNVFEKPDEIFRIVGYLPEDPEVHLVTLTVEDEVAFGPSNLGLSKEEIEERVEWALRTVNGLHLRERSTFDLSGGETEKVALASILALKPKVLILDEPSTFLEASTVKSLYKTLRTLILKENMTVIIIEHSVDKLIRLADELIVLNNGELVWKGKLSYLTVEKMLKLPIPKPELIELIEALKINELYNKPLLEIDHRSFSEYIKPIIVDETKYDVKKDAVVIKSNNLWFKYPRSSKWALKGISISIRKGVAIGILGPNGSGKTTFIKALAGIIKPVRGDLTVLNIKPHKEWHKLVGKVGYVPQNPSLTFTQSTVFKEVYATALKLRIENPDEETFKTLELMGLEKYAQLPVLKLSYGMRRRLSIASVLVSKPEILLLDEPTSFLDYDSKRSLINILKKLKGKTTLIIASHDSWFISQVCDEIALLKDGKIVIHDIARNVFYREPIETCMIEFPEIVKIFKEIYGEGFLGPLSSEELISEVIGT